VVGLEKSDNRTLETVLEDIEPAELLEFILCAGFQVSKLFNKTSPRGTMVLLVPKNVRRSHLRSLTRTSEAKTSKNIGTGSQRM
jgi:hypothetical protein